MKTPVQILREQAHNDLVIAAQRLIEFLRAKKTYLGENDARQAEIDKDIQKLQDIIDLKV